MKCMAKICNSYHKKSEQHLSRDGSKRLFCCKDYCLEGANLCRLTPFDRTNPPQLRPQRCCGDHRIDDDYEPSIKSHNQSGYFYTPSSYFCNAKPCTKGSNPPPPDVSAFVKKNHKLHNSCIPCNLRLGDSVKINSSRESRTKYNGMIGKVCAVIWPRDIERTIIYVQVAKMQPCFFDSELQFVAPQPTTEVQPCE